MSDDSDVWIGFDLGGTKMMAQVYDSSLKLLGKEKRKTRAAGDKLAGIERVVETIATALNNAQVSPNRIRGIGIGGPGPVDMERGVLLSPPNLAWDRLDLRDCLQAAFDCRVAVLNDVDAGVYAEYRFGAGRGARCVLGIFPGTGIGGGCVYNGEILRAKKNSCLEIGHILAIPNGPLCGCGQRGCLEAVASRSAIAAQAALAAQRGDAPALAKQCGTDLANIRSRDLAEAIAAGDTIVADILAEAARQIGIVAAGVVNLLCPEVIILGGGLVEALPGPLIEGVAKSARKRVMSPFRDSFKVVAAERGDDATALGAAAWAKQLFN